MAIEKTPKKANHFWPAFYNRNLLLIFITQILICLAFGAMLVAAGLFIVDSMLYIVIGVIFLTNLTSSLLIFKHTTRPTKDLMAAIAHISGQESTLAVPESNNKKNKRTGFQDALQIIYSLSAAKEEPKIKAQTKEANSKKSDVLKALDLTTCGFVTLNNDRVITYYNKAAPVHTNTEGVKTLDLLFNGEETLDNWLENCDRNSVNAERIWSRIPNRLPNQEDRRFFDVMASYQKGATAETVLTLIDRSALYSVDEDNLDFLSFAAHELRGPITVIRGYLDVLEEELSDVFKGDQHEMFSRLIVSANRLSGYIDNILNTSRYDRRHLKMNLVEDTVAAVYDVISDDMQLRAGSQNRLLATKFPSDLPTIAADRSSLSEVFGNLIDNAIKYSNEGGSIYITASVAGDFVEVAVQDHGIGMPESVVNNLFQKFYRSHRSRETVAGTGIGLYISKAIIESHGGIISVQSEDGKGSTFTVSIPIYATVADKLIAGDNSNESLISEGKGWIKNHSMFRG